MSTPEKFTDIHGNSFLVTASEAQEGHVYLEMLSNNPGRWIPGEDAPAVALAILEAAGIDNSASRHLAAAWRNLNRHVSERKQEAEREAEAAKVREFVEAIPGVSYLDESPEHWQVLYRAAREFFKRAEGTVTVPAYASDPGFEQLVDLASRAREESLKPAPRILQYGDAFYADQGVAWRSQPIGTDGRFTFRFEGVGWHYTTEEGETVPYMGKDLSDLSRKYFPMTEVTE